jgi:hypothetical protein
VRFKCAPAAALAALMATCSVAPAAADAADRWAINGTFSATSNGEWARKNEIFSPEAVVRATWTITTTCRIQWECSGTVTSDQGWSAPITSTNLQWVVKHDVPDWEPCPDGTAATGEQIFSFFAADERGIPDEKSTTYVGLDATTGPSGACGINRALVISMPFKLIKLS